MTNNFYNLGGAEGCGGNKVKCYCGFKGKIPHSCPEWAFRQKIAQLEKTIARLRLKGTQSCSWCSKPHSKLSNFCSPDCTREEAHFSDK